jgi:hypothetical protein
MCPKKAKTQSLLRFRFPDLRYYTPTIGIA